MYLQANDVLDEIEKTHFDDYVGLVAHIYENVNVANIPKLMKDNEKGKRFVVGIVTLKSHVDENNLGSSSSLVEPVANTSFKNIICRYLLWDISVFSGWRPELSVSLSVRLGLSRLETYRRLYPF